MQVSQIAKNLVGKISENSPIILTGVAASGVLATAIFAVKATPKALELIDEEVCARNPNKQMYNLSAGQRMALIPKLDIVKLTWKCYIPAVTCGAVTVASICALNSVHSRRNAALAGLYSLTETAFKEYQSKVVETIGKNKEQDIRDNVSKDILVRNPLSANEVIITGKGDVLCYDTVSGRYFKSDIERIRRIINELNKELMDEMWVNLNEFYTEVGLGRNTLGDDVGWNIDNGLIDIRFSSQLADDGNPCLVLNYEVVPGHQFK